MSNDKKELLKLMKRRLKAIKYHWDGAYNNYFNIDIFLTNINSAIQELRNLTFLLQKHKRLYGKFDSRYKDKQNEMKNNNKLCWIVKSRNRIVKEKDLKIYSQAYVSLVNRIELTLPTIKLDPFLSDKEIVDLFLKQCNNKTLNKISKKTEMPILKVKKKWIDKNYKDNENTEILLLIKYGFNYFNNLLSEFFTLIKLDHSLNYKIDIEKLANKQTYFLDIDDNSHFKIKQRRIEFSNNFLDDIKEKIGNLEFEKTNFKEKKGIINMMLRYLNNAKIIRSKCQHPPTFIYLSKDYKPISFQQGLIKERKEKYIWIRKVANHIKANTNIYAVLLIGEVFIIDKNKIEEYKSNPSLENAKGEALSVLFLNKKGNEKEVISQIYKKDGKMSFGKNENYSKDRGGILNPIKKVWDII